ncbi:hypothetical protein LXA43DRAFT_1067771, partial [Ganoderma leucocontextum]
LTREQAEVKKQPIYEGVRGSVPLACRDPDIRAVRLVDANTRQRYLIDRRKLRKRPDAGIDYHMRLLVTTLENYGSKPFHPLTLTTLMRDVKVAGDVVKKLVAGRDVKYVVLDGRTHTLAYPVPIVGSQRKLRLARKSSYIEVVVLVAIPFLQPDGLKLNPFPVVRVNASFFPWNVRRVCLDQLPVVNIESTNIPQLKKCAPCASERSPKTGTPRCPHRPQGDDPKHHGARRGDDRPGHLAGFVLQLDGSLSTDTLLFVDKIRYDVAFHTMLCDGAEHLSSPGRLLSRPSEAEVDIVTHLVVCASQDLVVGNYVMANQVQRKWSTKVIAKVSAGAAELGEHCRPQPPDLTQLAEEKMQLGDCSSDSQSNRASNLKYDAPEYAPHIRAFIAFHNLSIDKVRDMLYSFKTFSEFFYRKLKPAPDVHHVENPDEPGR